MIGRHTLANEGRNGLLGVGDEAVLLDEGGLDLTGIGVGEVPECLMSMVGALL